MPACAGAGREGGWEKIIVIKSKAQAPHRLLCCRLSQQPPAPGTLCIAAASQGSSGCQWRLSQSSPHENQTNTFAQVQNL